MHSTQDHPSETRHNAGSSHAARVHQQPSTYIVRNTWKSPDSTEAASPQDEKGISSFSETEYCIYGPGYCSVACSTQILLHGYYLKIFSCNFINIYDFNYVYAYTIDIVCINKTGLGGGELLFYQADYFCNLT